MEWKDLVLLVQALAWPVLLLFVILIFRTSIGRLLERIREFQGPGHLKVSLYKQEVEDIIKEGKERNDPPEKTAALILQSLDKRESRILRALFDEKGRAMYSYQNSYYQDALESLLKKEYVQKHDQGYALTDKGTEFTIGYLQSIIGRRKTGKQE